MILGLIPDPFASAPPAFFAPPSQPEEAEEGASRKRKKERRREKEAAGEGAGAEAATEKQERKRLRREARALAEAAPPDAEEEEEEGADEEGAPEADWWGAAMFRWAGRLGGVKRSKGKRGFSEADQVEAFEVVTGGKSEGRRGLGIRDVTQLRKVGGVRSAGTKTTTFD